MHAFILAAAATLLAGSASAAVLPVADISARGLTHALPPSSSASLDTSECVWKSEDALYVAFAALIPGGNSDALKKALKGNSACSGFSQYQSEMVGAKSGTLFAGFWASDFCTADDVTKIIKKAGGQTINCDKYKESEAEAPGPDNLLAEMWEDGDDGEDVSIKRDVDQPESLKELFGVFWGNLNRNGTLPTRPAGQ